MKAAGEMHSFKKSQVFHTSLHLLYNLQLVSNSTGWSLAAAQTHLDVFSRVLWTSLICSFPKYTTVRCTRPSWRRQTSLCKKKKERERKHTKNGTLGIKALHKQSKPEFGGRKRTRTTLPSGEKMWRFYLWGELIHKTVSKWDQRWVKTVQSYSQANYQHRQTVCLQFWSLCPSAYWFLFSANSCSNRRRGWKLKNKRHKTQSYPLK